jgi:hypothetical protein
MEGEHAAELPLKFDGFYGLRDGAWVNAEARFADGADQVTMRIRIYLRPPAEFSSGTYQGMIGGKMAAGRVECPSLTFQGGQTALPTVGGLFLLKDDQNRTVYRVRIPATELSHSRSGD